MATPQRAHMDTLVDSTTIRLWSFQTPGHCLLCGNRDPGKSPRTSDAGITAAYAELHSRLGTDQLIWCYTRRESFPETGIPKIEWVLDVPIAKTLRFYDSVVWARIIGKAGSTLPDKLRWGFGEQAIVRFPQDPDKAGAYETKLADAFWNQAAPTGNWWNHLFVDRPNGAHIDALIRHPVDASMVAGRVLHPAEHRLSEERSCGRSRRNRQP